MKFTWDADKSERNEQLRGFGFAYAASVFLDANLIEGFSRRKDGEERYFVIGQAPEGQILFVVYTWRQYEEEQVCRIISARIASRHERKRYSELR